MQAPRVTGSIQTLMMLRNDFRQIGVSRESTQTAQQRRTEYGMPLFDFPLVCFPRFTAHLVLWLEHQPAQVMQQAGNHQQVTAFLPGADFATDEKHQSR